jgi:hypothetical protein
MDSQERFENMFGLVEAHQYEWAIWQAARRGEPDGQPVVDAMQAYLRQCRVGGMSKEVSDQIERAVKQASHLGYFAAPTPERAQESAECMAKCDELRKDAERYRWLRSDDIEGEREIYVVMEHRPFSEEGDMVLMTEDLDDAIDAAMAKKEPQP